MDEMKIESGLVFDKHNGTLTGFVDLGSVADDIELVLSDVSCERTLTKHAFVFLARANPLYASGTLFQLIPFNKK